MEKYDGWTIKVLWCRNPFLIMGYCHSTKSGVIKDFEKTMGKSWQKYRNRGQFKIVKVKLVEVK